MLLSHENGSLSHVDLRGDDVIKLEIARQMIYDDLTFEGYVIEYRTTGH